MRVAIIDYGSGNLRSATKAFARAAHEPGLDATIELTDKAGQYERLYQRASRSIVLELDFDEDGEIDERRALYVVELQRL